MKKPLCSIAAFSFSLVAVILLFSGSISAQGIGNGNGNNNGQGNLPIKGGPVLLPFWKMIGNAADTTSFIGTTNPTPFNIKINNVLKGSFTDNGIYLFDGIYISKSAVIDSMLQVFSVQVSDALTSKIISAEQYFQNDTLVDLVGMQYSVGNLQSEVNSLSLVQAGLTLTVDSLQTAVEISQTEISTLNSEILIHDSSISSIQSQVSGIEQTQWKNDTVNSGNIYFDSGKVGIGTSSPAAKLDVYGSQRITNDLYVGGEVLVSDKFSAKTVASDTTVTTKQLFVNHNLLLGRDSGSTESDIVSRVDKLLIQSDPSTSFDVVMAADNTSRIGIGTRTPTEKLTVDGSIKVSGNIISSGTISANTFNANKFSADTLSVSRITSPDSIIAFGDSTVLLNTVFHRLYVHDAATAGITIGNARINTTGFGALFQFLAQSALGKNSTAIGYNIRVSPSANNAMVLGSGLQTGTFTGTQSGYLENHKANSLMVGFNTSGNIPTLYVGPADGTQNSTGNVGIGTNNPATKLTVTGDGFGFANIGGGFCGGDYTGISLNGQNVSCGVYNLLSSPSDKTLYINRPTGSAIRFRENNSDQMIIAPNGFVGIGTPSPDYKLDVCGAIRSNEWIVENFTCADFVFDENYIRPKYYEKEKWLKEKKHLRGIPSAKEIEQEGMKAGETISGIIMNTEENSLDVIDLYKENIQQKYEIENLKVENTFLKKKYEELELRLKKIEDK